MALLAAQSATKAGVALTFNSCAGGGDTVRIGDRTYIIIKNADASPKTVTVDVPGNTAWGQANPDAVIVVAAGAQTIVGPIDSTFAQPGTNPATANLTYSAVTNLTIAVIS